MASDIRDKDEVTLRAVYKGIEIYSHPTDNIDKLILVNTSKGYRDRYVGMPQVKGLITEGIRAVRSNPNTEMDVIVSYIECKIYNLRNPIENGKG